MDNHFYKKKAIMVHYLALDLLQLKTDDKMLSISACQDKYNAARGTVQNALNYLKEQKAIICSNRGHLGTFIKFIDYSILQKYALIDVILGTMTLPYSKLYEGFATGLYLAFEQHNIKLNLAYLRGAKERVNSIVKKTYRFAVISRYSANHALSVGEPIEIIADFGDQSYLSRHVILFSDKNKSSIEDGMKIGIDYSSLDQELLTKKLVKSKDITLIETSGHQIIHALNSGLIDAGVWNYDEISNKDFKNLNYLPVDFFEDILDMTASVIVCHRDDQVVKTIISNILEQETILKIQNSVVNGDMIPRY
ncbi:GntR family transcriptional regulator YhfZ [Orbus sturtevantii]|uniref:GntR family transcriptional regulator YhfZ n=1 Tax=Orbus sturtevantii TaxID=3074109 RepID=UPI00370DD26D